MLVIQQDILSGPQYPRSLTVQQVSANDVARQFTKRLSEPGTEDIVPVGIAYHISGKGKVDFMCLAQPNAADVLLISLQKAKFGSVADFLCPSGGGLASKICLVGFGMAQIAIQVSHATNSRVKGVDLLTLFPDLRSPSELVKTVDNKVKKSAVRRLWMGNNSLREERRGSTGLVGSVVCPLSVRSPDTRDHLYFPVLAIATKRSSSKPSDWIRATWHLLYVFIRLFLQFNDVH
jgi:hypothetical protein